MGVDIDSIYKILSKEVKSYKVPVVELIKTQTKDPEKVLIATMLSARTSDIITSRVVSQLFKKINKIKDFKKYNAKDIEKMIYPVGFYHTKARHLKKLPTVFQEEFNSILPSTVEELIKLPGVGRKTANLVVAIGFNKPAICVDVHAHRIMNRLGYVKTKTPFETEMALRKKLPQKYWIRINTILVAFGQNLCSPIRPFCSKCPVYEYCNKVGVKNNR